MQRKVESKLQTELFAIEALVLRLRKIKRFHVPVLSRTARKFTKSQNICAEI